MSGLMIRREFLRLTSLAAGAVSIPTYLRATSTRPWNASRLRESILSGVTQSVLHGFNYSPLAIPFPGWVRCGTYFSERNSWWPYFKLWVDYKACLSALFQHAEMQADIAILPPRADLAALMDFSVIHFPGLLIQAIFTNCGR